MGTRGRFSLKDYSNVARMEYLPAEAPAIFIPLMLTATALKDFFNPFYWEAVLIFSLLYFAGFIINSYTDVNVDEHYKIYVATSSKKMGPSIMMNLVILQVGIATILVFHLSWAIGRLWLIPICMIGIFMGLAYSIKPFEFKVKGFMHVVSLCISAFAVPLILLYSTQSGDFPWYILTLFIGFPIAHYGIALANQTGDFLEDKSEGLSSPAVKWGLNKTLKLAKTMSLIGLGIELISFYGIIYYSQWAAELGASVGILPITAKLLVMVLITAIMCIMYSVPLRGLFSIHDISKMETSIESRMSSIKSRMNYPIWQASAIWGLVLTSTIIMVGSLASGA